MGPCKRPAIGQIPLLPTNSGFPFPAAASNQTVAGLRIACASGLPTPDYSRRLSIAAMFNSILGPLAFGLRRALAVRLLAAAATCTAVAGCAANLSPPPIAQNEPGAAQQGQTAPGRTQRTRPVTIGMILPQQGFGQAALVGKGLKQAGELALFESGNSAVQLVVKNDNGNLQSTTAAAQEAIADGAEVIVGPLFAKTVPAVAGVARPTGVPVLSFSNDRAVAGNGVYLLSTLPETETDRIVSFALSRSKKTFAALIPQGLYGDRVEQAFRSAVERGGGRVVALERFAPGANQILEPAKRVFDVMKEAASFGTPVDALFLPGNQDNLSVLGPQIGLAEIDKTQVQLIGLGGWDYPNIGRDQVFVGGWYPSPDPAGFQAFSERFAKTFGQAPPRMATLAYDAVRMAIGLAGRPKGQRFTQANLTMPAGFEGVDGRFALLPSGTTRRGLAVLEVQRFGTQVVDPAPVLGVPQRGGFAPPLGAAGAGRAGIPVLGQPNSPASQRGLPPAFAG